MVRPRSHDGRHVEIPGDEAHVPLEECQHEVPLDPRLAGILRSASRLQTIVPDAILVGGSAAAFYARHRISLDHDHLVRDLSERFDAILDSLAREPDWILNRATPGKIILGSLGDIEAGVRQMIRKRPLEAELATVTPGVLVRVPTHDEILRIKAFLVVKRNQVRDYLDVAALSDLMGSEDAAAVLGRIDDYYADESRPGLTVATQVVRQLSDPRPRDTGSLRELPRYKGLATRWQDWETVRAQCARVAAHMLDATADDDVNPNEDT